VAVSSGIKLGGSVATGRWPTKSKAFFHEAVLKKYRNHSGRDFSVHSTTESRKDLVEGAQRRWGCHSVHIRRGAGRSFEQEGVRRHGPEQHRQRFQPHEDGVCILGGRKRGREGEKQRVKQEHTPRIKSAARFSMSGTSPHHCDASLRRVVDDQSVSSCCRFIVTS
jgi:hypothetical protein